MPRRPELVRLLAAAVVLLGVMSLGLVGCASTSTASSSGPVVALLLPESKTARYEDVDGPVFADVVTQRCPDCHVLRANADQDAARQQEQAESMLAQGADVLVIDAVDSVAAASIVAAASERRVPVIAYDRYLAGASYYVSFDSEVVGRMQGKVLVDTLQAHSAFSDTRLAGVLLVNGAATDPNSAGYKRGLMSVLDNAPVEVLAEYDTPDWSPDKAQAWVEAQLTIYGSRVDGVYAANDGTAAGAISALRAAGRDPVPPVTGQDAELAAIQRIVDGDQTMTVFKAIPAQARTAAELAVRVVRGETPATASVVDGVPSLLLNPVVITKADIQRVIVDGGVYTVDQICQQPYTRACNEAGLIPAGGS